MKTSILPQIEISQLYWFFRMEHDYKLFTDALLPQQQAALSPLMGKGALRRRTADELAKKKKKKTTNYYRHELQWIWLKKSICSEVQELITFSKKINNLIPLLLPHSLHHLCKYNSTVWPASDNNLVIDSNTTHLWSLPCPKKVTAPHTEHSLSWLLPQQRRTEAAGLFPGRLSHTPKQLAE